MLNTTLNNNPASMTTICNIQNMAKILKKDISFEYLETKKYSVLMELQDNLIPLYNKAVKDMQETCKDCVYLYQGKINKYSCDLRQDLICIDQYLKCKDDRIEKNKFSNDMIFKRKEF